MSGSAGLNVWMSRPVEREWLLTRDELQPQLLVSGIAFWITLHVLSMTFSDLESYNLTDRDTMVWHNRLVSSVHNLGALVAGFYWLVFSPEAALPATQKFGYGIEHDYISVFGMTYVIYDTAFMAWNHRLYGKILFPMLGHHILFILAYALEKYYPCTLAMPVLHFFQLTELSSVFLHLNWFMLRARAKPKWIFLNGMAVLATFAFRLVINIFLAGFVWNWILGRELLSTELPRGLSRLTIMFVLLVGVGVPAMLVLNFVWFRQLVQYTKDTIHKVEMGKSLYEDDSGIDEPVPVAGATEAPAAQEKPEGPDAAKEEPKKASRKKKK